MTRLFRLLYLSAVLGIVPCAGAEPPTTPGPAPESLPAPRTAQPLPFQQDPVAPAPGLLPLTPAYPPFQSGISAYPPPQPSVRPEFGRMSVWQLYAPDRTGAMRPVVVTTPRGAYYLYNGAPFPWTSTHSREYMLYVQD